LDLLEDAGIPPPRPPIITDEDRAELASIALAQRQFYFVAAFFAGMVGGAVIAYLIGYRDIVLTILGWVVSGTGLALIWSTLNLGKIYSYKCPRCDQDYFSGAPWGVFSKQCGTCGLPPNLPDVDLTP
jgi:predicted cobalt transporter CbtA